MVFNYSFTFNSMRDAVNFREELNELIEELNKNYFKLI